jgi:hypothetical protein
VGCLFALIAAFTPRFALFILWIWTNLVDRAFNGWLLPLLGFLILPYATLFYVLAYNPVSGVSFWGWFFVVIGGFMDLAHWSGGYATGRRRYATA